MKVNDKIKVHLYSRNQNEEIKTRNYDKIFTVYEKCGKLGIDWNTERSPYTCHGDIFTPFYTFADSVIFENIETGNLYKWDNIANEIVKIS